LRLYTSYSTMISAAIFAIALIQSANHRLNAAKETKFPTLPGPWHDRRICRINPDDHPHQSIWAQKAIGNSS